MPAGDGTGPLGWGPMTGRAAGYCAGFGIPGFMNPFRGRTTLGPYGHGACVPAPYGAATVPYGYPAGYFRRGRPGPNGFGRRAGWGRGRGFGRGGGRGRRWFGS